MEGTHYWHHLLAVYLFLGGLAGACFYTGALFELFGGSRMKRVAKIGSFCVLPIIIVSLIILVLDLARPLYFWHFIITIEPTSLMSHGTWLLTLFSIVGGVIVPAFFLSEEEKTKNLPVIKNLAGKDNIRKIFSVIGVILGFLVAGYTGVLLAVTTVPLWSTVNWLPVVFLASASSTGLALILLILSLSKKKDELSMGLLEKADSIVIVIEILAFAILLITLNAAGGRAAEAASVLLSGAYAIPFWIGIVAIGLVIPLTIELKGLTSKEAHGKGTGMAAIASILVLLGGFMVRWVFLYGGQVVR